MVSGISIKHECFYIVLITCLLTLKLLSYINSLICTQLNNFEYHYVAKSAEAAEYANCIFAEA